MKALLFSCVCGVTALCSAMSPELQEFLNQDGYRPDKLEQISEKTGNTPLIKAITFGKFDLVKELLKEGADPNGQNRFGTIPLHYAIAQGHKEIIKVLLKAGADPKAKNEQGEDALNLSHKHDDKEITALLENTGKIVMD